MTGVKWLTCWESAGCRQSFDACQVAMSADAARTPKGKILCSPGGPDTKSGDVHEIAKHDFDLVQVTLPQRRLSSSSSSQVSLSWAGAITQGVSALAHKESRQEAAAFPKNRRHYWQSTVYSERVTVVLQLASTVTLVN